MVAAALGCGRALPSTTPLGGEEEVGTRGSNEAGQTETPPTVVAQESEEEDGEDEGGETHAIVAEKPDASASEGEEGECKPSDAQPPVCHELQAGPCAEEFGQLCSWVAESLTPEVASAAVSCLVERNRHSKCAEVVDCVEPALGQACVEDGDRKWCEEFLKRCPKVKGFEAQSNQETCERARASLTDSTSEKIDACLGDGCDVMDCLDKLAPDEKD